MNRAAPWVLGTGVALVLFAASGMMFLAGAEDLIVLFLGLEVMSVSVYVLAGFNRGNVFSAEAALKYFLIGAFASAFLLYGIALVWGASGSTSLAGVGQRLSGPEPPLLGQLGLEPLPSGQQLAGVVDDGRPGVGEHQPAADPVEQLDAQLALEAPHAGRHRGLGDVEGGGGPAHAPVVDDGDDVLEVP